MASKSSGNIVFADVVSATETSVTVTPNEGETLILPLVPGRPGVEQRGNPFRSGDRVVLEFDTDRRVIGIEAFSDLVTGVVTEHRENRLTLGDSVLAVDGWSLARLGAGAGRSRVVALQGVALAAGTQVGVLVRRGRVGAIPRVGAVFVHEETK